MQGLNTHLDLGYQFYIPDHPPTHTFLECPALQWWTVPKHTMGSALYLTSQNLRPTKCKGEEAVGPA